MKRKLIGKGKNMSIAKAGLKYFYEDLMLDDISSVAPFITSGDLDAFHKIVDIAGAEHASATTHHQVLGCLRNSPYWEVSGETSGWGNKLANCYSPSEKGKKFYEEHIKKINI